MDGIPLLLAALTALAGLFAAYRQHGRHRRHRLAWAAEMRRLEAVIASAPMRPCALHPDDTCTADRGFAQILGLEQVGRLDDIAAALAPADAAALRAACADLRQTGRAFQLELFGTNGRRSFTISGGGGDDEHVLWLREETEAADRRHSAAQARIRAERALAERCAALDALPVPVWLRGPDLAIRWCNRAYARMVDTTPQCAVTEQRELASGASRALAERAHTSGAAQSEARAVAVGGDRRMLEVTETPLPASGPESGRDGSLSGLVGFALDVTRLEALRADLSRHITAHAQVLEHLGSAIAVFGPDTRLKFHNHAYVQLWQLDETWLAQQPTHAEILEDLRQRRRLPEYADFRSFKRERAAMFTSLMEAHEDLLHLPDGTTLRMLVVPHPLGGLMFVLEDVTHTLALESSYNTLMAVQQETLDNLAEGIAVFGGDGRLKLSNPAYRQMWSLTRADIAGEPHVVGLIEKMKRFFDYGEDWDGFKEVMVASTLDRAARNGRIVRTDGAIIEFTNAPLPDGAVLNSFLDVTASVHVEQALRASNAALEAADQLKTDFLANVSHHLRTPLTAIKGFGEILTNQYFGELNEKQLEYANDVLAACDRLMALLDDILDLATIEAGYMALDYGRVDVPTILTSVVSLTREWVSKHRLNLELDCPPDLGDIYADEKRIKQVLFNLVGNAIRFTPSGGRITLTGRRSRDSVTLTISDTGVGIPDADQQRVLQRFERANAHDPSQTGAGLGLALVKCFVELHGGHVEIDSRPGEGTSIRCILPARPRPALPLGGGEPQRAAAAR